VTGPAYKEIRHEWLTMASPEEPDGTELQLALNDKPAAKAYQQAIFQQGQPAAMLYIDDVKGDYEWIKARGAEFTMPPTDVTASTIARLNDTCGNLISSPSWHGINLSGGKVGSQRSEPPIAITSDSIATAPSITVTVVIGMHVR
jgi:hypothetical protein